MEIAYCVPQVYVPGGRERVVVNKINYLSRHGHNVTLITTDQGGLPSFYDIDPSVKVVDLNINYSLNRNRPFLKKVIYYFVNMVKHFFRLRRFLKNKNVDICISTFAQEMAYLPLIDDGSRKVLELHTQLALCEGGRETIKSIKKQIEKFDRFVVLTEKDRLAWACVNSLTIPNSLPNYKSRCSSVMGKKALAVGRLSYVKGFDRLVDIWEQIVTVCPDWILEIVGDGELKTSLIEYVEKKNLKDSIIFTPATSDIYSKYQEASMLLMTSRLEAFGMVLCEAQSCGLPCIAYDVPCGPAEIIKHNENGFLIENDNVKSFVDKFVLLASDQTLRTRMAQSAKVNSTRFLEGNIMHEWELLFSELIA